MSLASYLGLGRIESKIDLLSQKFDQFLQRENQLVKTIDDLQADVTAQTTVVQSTITLLNGIAAQLKAAAGEPAKILAIATGLEANTAALAAAVTANTAPAPAPAPSPAP